MGTGGRRPGQQADGGGSGVGRPCGASLGPRPKGGRLQASPRTGCGMGAGQEAASCAGRCVDGENGRRRGWEDICLPLASVCSRHLAGHLGVCAPDSQPRGS